MIQCTSTCISANKNVIIISSFNFSSMRLFLMYSLETPTTSRLSLFSYFRLGTQSAYIYSPPILYRSDVCEPSLTALFAHTPICFPATTKTTTFFSLFLSLAARLNYFYLFILILCLPPASPTTCLRLFPGPRGCLVFYF